MLCVGQLAFMQELADKYSGKAEFLFVYIGEAHPEQADKPGRRRLDRQPILQPCTYTERRETAERFAEECDVRRRIVVDGMEAESYGNQVFPDYPNPVMVVEPNGRIVFMVNGHAALELDRFLEDYLD